MPKLSRMEAFYRSDNLADYIGDFEDELVDRVDAQMAAEGRTWIARGRAGQEKRFMQYVIDLWKRWDALGDKKALFPWMEVAREALACWVRQKQTTL